MGGHPYSSVLRLCTHLALMEVSTGCFTDLNRPRVHQSTKLPPRRMLPNMSVLRSHSFAVASRNLEFARLTVRLPLGLVGWQLVVHCRVHVLPSGGHRRHSSRCAYAPTPQTSSSRRPHQKQQEAPGPRAPPPTTSLCAPQAGAVPLIDAYTTLGVSTDTSAFLPIVDNT